jgi:ABC-type nitrate/sulfonate/bicarbonate transport system substrate-binding protein
VLNLHGNAITLSNDLWKRGVRDGASLRAEILRSRRHKILTFGVVFPFSSHNFLLRGWLASTGIQIDRDVRIVVVPPPQMVVNLQAGHLDGFCVGEPWNSVAVLARAGWCVAASAELEPGHPEKVLMVRRDFADSRGEEHAALVAALIEACAYCDAPENRNEIVTLLSRREYVNAPCAAVRRGFDADFDFGHHRVRSVLDFNAFHRNDANEPTAQKAAWVIRHLRASGLCQDAALNSTLGRKVFRADLFEQALSLQPGTTPRTHQETRPNHALTTV